MDNDTPTKKCSKCGIDKQRSNFYRQGRKSDGLQIYCKDCVRTKRGSSKRISPYDGAKNGYKFCSICKKEKLETEEYFYKSSSFSSGYVSSCKECSKSRTSEYRLGHREEIAKKKAAEYLKNRERYKAQSRSNYHSSIEDRRRVAREHYHSNKEAMQKRDRARRKQQTANRRKAQRLNPDKYKIISHRYAARKRNLPDTLTKQEWQYALEYFNHCCAVCGRQLKDLFGAHTVAMDHWIPLSYEGVDNPGTVAENMIPLCHGQDGCNNSKGSKMPNDWLFDVYRKAKANRILKRIKDYFDSIK